MTNTTIGFLLKKYIKACGITVTIATTEADRNDAFGLRKNVYESANYSSQLNYPDEYDAHSIIINAYKDQHIVGSMRLSSINKGAFCFDLCNPNIPEDIPLSEIIEYGTLVVDKAFRKSNSLIFIALTEAAFQYSISNHFKYWYGFSIPQQIEHFKKINPHCTILETLPPTPKSLEKQQRFRDYFEQYGVVSKPFLFELDKVNYLHAILLLIKNSFKRNISKPNNISTRIA